MTDAVKVKQLSLQISGTRILEDICLSVATGKLVALIGPNGSGKTSLLNCISGLNRGFEGQVEVFGTAIQSQSQRLIASQLAYLHQHMPAELKLTVRQVVELGLIPHLTPWSMITHEQQAGIEQAIDKVNVSELVDRPFNSLSGGEKQRVLIAKTIVQNTRIILMDEPTNHLDIKHQIDILSLVKSLNLTTITCIHDVNLALAIADEIVCLNEGKIVFHKATGDITAQDFSAIYGVVCHLDHEPFHQRPRLSVKWN